VAPPENVPKWGKTAATADICSTVSTDRQSQFVSAFDFSATYIDHALAFALLFKLSSRKLEIRSFRSVACPKNKR
jgi:hypothetical protein